MKDKDMSFLEALSIVGTWIGATAVLILLVRALQQRERTAMNTAYGNEDESFESAWARLQAQIGTTLTEDEALDLMEMETRLGTRLYSRPYRPATIAPHLTVRRVVLFAVPQRAERFVPSETAKFIRHLVQTGRLSEQLHPGEME